jgi:hypothetical protein
MNLAVLCPNSKGQWCSQCRLFTILIPALIGSILLLISNHTDIKKYYICLPFKNRNILILKLKDHYIKRAAFSASPSLNKNYIVFF